MPRSPFAQLFFCIPVLLIACSSPSGMPDARDVGGDAVMDIATTVCHADIDCTDHVFCNGAEQCTPGAASANALGCVAANPANPCLATQSCNEAMMRCETGCGATPDADHDGHRSIACGGDDCDDTDANRFPGNAEVCDAAGHDEDCSPCTVAGASPDGDADHDSFVSTSCFNTYAGPTPTTCDPLRTVIDGRHARVTGSDCDDTNNNVRPNQSEICDGIDNNCNVMIDEGDPGGGGSCGSPSPNVCRMGVNHCVAGAVTCQIDFSTPGYCCAAFADCNGMTSDGCEVNVATDAHNCASCFTVCPATGGTPSCNAGVCGFASCSTGLSACGSACVNEQADVLNCGGCAHICPSSAGTPECNAGTCGYSTCAAGLALCGSECVDLQNDPLHCAACSHPCPGADGIAVCGAGVCGYSACTTPGLTLCGSSCVNRVTDLNNCGACGSICPSSAGTPQCVASVCGYSACNGGLGVCSGQCFDLRTDPSHCGTCGTVCTAPAAAVPTCSADTCGFRCSPGYVLSLGNCAPSPPPRQLAPLSTATVTSQRPLFRWTLPGGADGGRVDICTTRACTSIVTSFMVSGASGMPPSALGAGIYYWRVRGTYSGALGTQVSPVWEFWVGARSATTNASWGTTLDVNGDGFADVAVGAYGVGIFAGRAYVYLGSAGGIGASPSITLVGPDGDNAYFGYSVASAGDVNGDGFGDLIVGDDSPNAFVYLGSAAGIRSSPDITLTGADSAFGSTVSSAGDVNGDGFADVAVAALSTVSVFLGSASGTSTTAVNVLSGYSGSGGQYALAASAGDVNGDGFGDLAVGANGGLVSVFLGSATGLASVPAIIGSGFAINSVACAGDVNGDGYADLIAGWIGGAPGGRALVYLGSVTGLTLATTLVGSDGANAWFGVSVASAGDVNGDGFADVVVGASRTNTNSGSAHVYLGSVTGLATSPATSLSTSPLYQYFGSSVAGAGDVNGDGFADVIVGAYAAGVSAAGRAFVFLGSVAGTSSSPGTTLNGPDGANGNFGWSVACGGGVNRGRFADMFSAWNGSFASRRAARVRL